MQIQPEYKDQIFLLNEIQNIVDTLDFIYDIRWHRFIFLSDEYHATTRVYDYLSDLLTVKWMIYNANAANAVAAGS